MQMVIAAKLVSEKKWEGAVIADGKFQRALMGNSIADMVSNALTGVLVPINQSPVGTEVAINISTEVPTDAGQPQDN